MKSRGYDRGKMPGLTAVIAVLMVPCAASAEFAYDEYAAVLKAYVNDNGMVNYKALKRNRERLDAFATALGTLDPNVYETWDEKAKIAFWVNAYNGLTLKVIIDNYPIQSSFAASLRFPKNSIRQISGVWDAIRFRVVRRRMTLEEIEHKTLRAKFNEPRIHMALVCAAKGCPILRNEPYTGPRLDAQLDDQTRRFLKDSRKFRVDRSARRVYLSPIFKWFGEDFMKTHGTDKAFTEHDAMERAVLHYISKYVEADARAYLANERYRIAYLGYDWSLNEQ